MQAIKRFGGRALFAFFIGALAMITFHQSAVGLFHEAGMFPVRPFILSPSGPLRVPAVVNGAFWSGLWGVMFLLAFLPLMRRVMPEWVAGFVWGFVVPVATLFLVVAPLKGQPIAYSQPWDSMLRIALAHGFWGFGMAALWRGLGGERA